MGIGWRLRWPSHLTDDVKGDICSLVPSNASPERTPLPLTALPLNSAQFVRSDWKIWPVPLCCFFLCLAVPWHDAAALWWWPVGAYQAERGLTTCNWPHRLHLVTKIHTKYCREFFFFLFVIDVYFIEGESLPFNFIIQEELYTYVPFLLSVHAEQHEGQGGELYVCLCSCRKPWPHGLYYWSESRSVHTVSCPVHH